MSAINEIMPLLRKARLPLADEKELQCQISLLFDKSRIYCQKEYMLDSKNRPDFFINGIAVEVKIKGTKKTIFRQLQRYAAFDNVKEILLITNKSMGLPPEINSKPTYFLNLGAAWL